MDFHELYKSSISMWPDKIDISDAQILDNRFLFKNLSSIWNEVEMKAKEIDEWHDLMTWIIFGGLHDFGKQHFNSGIKFIFIDELDPQEIKLRFEDNLRVSGYEDMLEEYKLLNK